MKIQNRRLPLLCTSAFVSALAGAAAAQAPVATATDTTVGEIVITATRQAVSINKAPISVSAVAQDTLDKQGVENLQDLTRMVPGLGFRQTGGDRVPQIAIRGIAATGGSQTTGVYLDDTPLQKRGILGSPTTGSGTPIPSIFDLDRVEVLKGPQGTLYGGSSEGGTIRFITPTPSLTKYSGVASAEVSSVDSGGVGHDLRLAFGGPILEDKIGFRLSLRERRQGGYIDDVSRFTGATVASDTNYVNSTAVRLAVLFKPTERLEITPSIYMTSDVTGDLDNYWLNIGQTVLAARSYTAAGVLTTDPTQAVHTQPGYTYGPYNVFGPYRSGEVTNIGDAYANQITPKPLLSPNRRFLNVYSDNAQYSFDKFKINLITSYTTDQSAGSGDVSFADTRTLTGYPFVFNLPVYFTRIDYDNRRKADTEELRFTSVGDGPLTWVAGLYRSDSNERSYTPSYWNDGAVLQLTRGITDTQYYGVPLLDPSTSLTGIRDQRAEDREYAAYADLTYAITRKLKLTAGVRVSQVTVAYYGLNYGQAAGVTVPTVANGGIVAGNVTEKPVTPKFGISYQLNQDSLVYANAAQGYRPGGVNLPASATLCAKDFAAIGITASPATYASDSVWSYEAGLKQRLFERTQVNSSIYWIDWKTPQTSVTLPTCGNSYLINAGKAVSRGFDSQVTSRLAYGFSFVGSVAYTDAQQLQAVGLNTSTHPIFVAQGDRLPVPVWSYNVGGQYDWDMFSQYHGYVRMDYQFTSPYQRSAGPGTTTFAPDTYMAGATHDASVRAGINFGRYDVTVYANNVFNSQDLLSLSGGRSGCTTPACTTYGSFNPIFVAFGLRPREVGLSLAAKY